MHRHVRRVGDQRAVGGEHRAGEIEPLLDVDRIGGVLQRHAHLLGDRHEQVVEHFEHDRIGVGADRVAARQRHGALQHQVVLGGDLGAPAVLDHDGLMRLDDDRRAHHRVAGRKLRAGEDRGVVPGAAGIEAGGADRRGQGGGGDVEHRLGKFRAAADRFDRHRFDHELLGLVDEAEARFVRLFERRLHRASEACPRPASRRSAPSPLEGEGWGGGWIWRCASSATPPPGRLRGRPPPQGERWTER